MKISIIDIGTQSIKHYIFEVSGQDKNIFYYKRYSESKLGENENIGPETIARNIAILQECVSKNGSVGVSKTQLLGTDILRKATNAKEFLNAVESACALTIKIISHEDEARYLYEGFVSIVPKDTLFASVNIGGGSTEFVIGDSRELKSSFKIPFGVRFLRNEFPAGDGIDWNGVETYLDKQIQIETKVPILFVTGVVIESLTKVGTDHGFTFTAEDIPRHPYSINMPAYDAFIQVLQKIPIPELSTYYPKDPSYADGVALSHTVYRAIAKKIGAQKIILSGNDLTDGVIHELLK